jgi:hypothetical protein
MSVQLQIRRLLRLSVPAGCLLVICLRAAAQDGQSTVSFDRDIRPILSDLCFTCHGPDSQQRKSDLRLDQREGLFGVRDGQPVVVAGAPVASLLIQRVTSADPDLQMPPPDFERRLSAEQVQVLQRWIQQGAHWTAHWSFIKPQAVQPPVAGDRFAGWCRNPIDQFVLSGLENAGLTPSAEADRRTLIRRVSLDLTGLPPTPAEVQSFVTDTSPEAWDRVIDRLLSTPSYGEHQAVAWLDAARYADTSGYQNDGPRSMWRWRDWVIDAFNRNVPFDQFTIEQIAGDLLPSPTLDQRIATGFNRNHRGNAEGGIIPEEYQVEYVADRVDTTFAVWQGLTMGCARCHDHKYDPLRQLDYYQVFAWFNNLPESGRAIKEGNSPPLIQAPLPEQQQQLQRLGAALQLSEQRTKDLQPALARAVQEWQSSDSAMAEPDWSVTDGLTSHFPLAGNLHDVVSQQQAQQQVMPDGSTVFSLQNAAGFGYFDRFTFSSWVQPSADTGTLISRMIPVEHGEGYYVHLEAGRVQINLVKRWLDDAIRVESQSQLPLNTLSHLAVVYDGTRLASGIRLYVNGVEWPLEVRLDRLNQTFAVKAEPLRLGGGQSTFRGTLSDVRVYSRDLTRPEVQRLSVLETVQQIVQIPPGQRTPAQQDKLEWMFLERHADADLNGAFKDVIRLRRELRSLHDQIPTVMVMQELPVPRQTHVLLRGQYDRPGAPVQPDIPQALAGSFVPKHGNRLDLAEWLVSPDNPLTARVAVNRIWQRFFEHGLVRTTEDFGSQGERPSHPELLDWLSLEFIRSGWDLKALQRLIVQSATYRQSSHQHSQLQTSDPENRLLSRGTRRRLSAETIRDQALFLSGLLSRRVGGPSVKPYQPAGLWQEIATDTAYEQSRGEDLYRRSLYTYWKRTVAPPTLVTFDATTRESCVVSRSRTNTPLQALVLMNDVTFVEAARVMAQNELKQPADSIEGRVGRLFRLVTAREPATHELEILCNRYRRNLELYRERPESAVELSRSGEYPVDDSLDPCELAALTTVTCVLLNLDEVITKE